MLMHFLQKLPKLDLVSVILLITSISGGLPISAGMNKDSQRLQDSNYSKALMSLGD